MSVAPPTEAEVKEMREHAANVVQHGRGKPGIDWAGDAYKVVALCDAYLAQQPVVEAAHDPFLVIVEYHPDADQVANAEMKRAADRFRAALSAAPHRCTDPDDCFGPEFPV